MVEGEDGFVVSTGDEVDVRGEKTVAFRKDLVTDTSLDVVVGRGRDLLDEGGGSGEEGVVDEVGRGWGEDREVEELGVTKVQGRVRVEGVVVERVLARFL